MSHRPLSRLIVCACWSAIVAVSSGGGVRAQESLSVRIDRHIAAGADYAAMAAPLSDDAEFIRRVSLDLNGIIPTSTQVREFLASTDPNKRTALVDKLLADPLYARHMQRTFDVILMQRRNTQNVAIAEWQKYLRESFAANKPWDQLAREILSTDGTDPALRPAARFFLDRDGDPHLITRDVGRLFLGVNLECAQCHDHPQIDDYKQQHYHGIHAFLVRSTLFRKGSEPLVLAEKADGEVTFESVFDLRDKKSTGPKTTLPVLFDGKPLEEPKFEKGQEYKVKPEKDVRGIPNYSRREKLGPAVADPASRRFARAISNRVWGLMFGRGIIDPLELDHSDNPPSHPELLEELTTEMIARKYDLKSMLREIALSQTYQRSGRASAAAPAPPAARFAVAPLRPLTCEQLAWSFCRAVGLLEWQKLQIGANATDEQAMDKLTSVEPHFQNRFASEPGRIERGFDARSDQSLFMAHDGSILAWAGPMAGNLAERVLKLPADQTPAIADELYLSTLSRPATAEEAADVAAYLAERTADRPQAVVELVWALVNSTEFRFSH